MSKISLSPDIAGTGIFTIASPGTSTNRTLTLPDDTGTIVTNSGNQAGSFTTLNTSGAVVFNDAGADVDFRVESDTNENAFFLDGATGNVGIGTASVDTNNGAVGLKFGLKSAQNNVISGESSGNDLNGIILESRKTGRSVSGRYAQIGMSESSDNGVIRFSTAPSGSDVAERMRITEGGDLLLNTTTAEANFKSTIVQGGTAGGIAIKNGGSSGTPIRFITSSGTAGNITTSGTTTTYGTSSDYRLKENVVPMTGAIAKVLELNPVTYTWKVDGSAGEGFIAHELQAVCPDAVVGEKDATEIQRVQVSPAVEATYDDEGNELTPAVEAVYEEREVPAYQGMDTSFLVATLTAAIQELSAKNDSLEARIASLEAK